MALVCLLSLSLAGCGRAEKVKETKGGCDLACANYVDKCLTLVPGATQQLYVDGLDSCVQECQGWGSEKTECILNAQNCTSMTDECEL